MSGWRRSAPRKEPAYSRTSVKGVSVQDHAAKVAGGIPYLADATLMTASTAQTHAFVSSIYLLGASRKRTGWPEKFPQLAERFTALGWSA